MRDDSTDGLPARLRTMMGRLNLSRVALAREMGVDKSVIGRWLSGATHPTEHNLSRLTDLLRRLEPSATMAHWEAAAPPAPAALDVAALRVPTSDAAMARAAGLWAGLFHLSEGSRLRPCLLDLSPVPRGSPGSGLAATLWDGSNEAQGTALAGASWLNLLLHVAVFEDRLWMIALHSPSGVAPDVMTGILTTGFPGVDESPAVTSAPVVLVRVGDPDTARRLRAAGDAQPRLVALRRRIATAWQEAPDDALERMGLVAPAVAEVLRPPSGRRHPDGGTAYALRLGRAVCGRLSVGGADSPVARSAAGLRAALGLDAP